LGELIATPARGALMGNRGCLHDAGGQIRRAFVGRRWIICVLQFKERRRRIMTPGRYTELFFLDEATALAAGHRPCAECQRERYLQFRERWRAGRGRQDRAPAVAELDAILHAERLDAQRRQRTHEVPAAGLPDGVMVVDDDGRPCLVHQGRLLAWTPAGYDPPGVRARTARAVLTPPSIVAAIRRGYPVGVHPSAVVS
jgi:hypothetical protein